MSADPEGKTPVPLFLLRHEFLWSLGAGAAVAISDIQHKVTHGDVKGTDICRPKAERPEKAERDKRTAFPISPLLPVSKHNLNVVNKDVMGHNVETLGGGSDL